MWSVGERAKNFYNYTFAADEYVRVSCIELVQSSVALEKSVSF